MKRGRELFIELSALEEAAMIKRVHELKGAEMAALAHYMQGLEATEEVDRLLGTVFVVGAFRYFAKARKKQARRARRIL